MNLGLSLVGWLILLSKMFPGFLHVRMMTLDMTLFSCFLHSFSWQNKEFLFQMFHVRHHEKNVKFGAFVCLCELPYPSDSTLTKT